MNAAEFFKAAEQLDNWSLSLRLTVESRLGEVEDLLCRRDVPLPEGVTAQAMAGLCLRGVEKKLLEVLYAYDCCLEALGFRRRFDEVPV